MSVEVGMKLMQDIPLPSKKLKIAKFLTKHHLVPKKRLKPSIHQAEDSKKSVNQYSNDNLR